MGSDPSAALAARSPAEIADVRRRLVRALRDAGLSPERVDEVTLLATELVSNVLNHTRSTARLTYAVDHGEVTVRVFDDDERLPDLRPVDPTRVGGNGLRIVDALSARWGVEPGPAGGKVVWFCLPAG